MAPGDAWKKKVSNDEMLNRLKIALQDARVGTVALSKPELTPQPKPVTAHQASRAVRQPHRSRSKKATALVNSDSDSNDEMRMVCTTDLTGEIAKAEVARRNRWKKDHAATTTKLNAGEALESFGLRCGEVASEKLAFVPWKFLVRYAELYVGKANTPIVEPYFDGNAVFENQIWDFFYLYEPEDLNAAPICFVPTSQLEMLLSKINEKHSISLKVPDGSYSKFFYKFASSQSTPQPRYLGRTSLDATSFKGLLDGLPLPDPEDEVIYALTTEIEHDGFAKTLKKIKDSWGCSKGDGKTKSKKSAFKRYDNRKAWGHTTKRVQRYLGLRKKSASARTLSDFLGQHEAPVQGPALDLSVPLPFPLEDDVVFICFDIETYERIPKLVTEIGFAILDTRDIRGVAPGDDGKDWFPFIQARHFRVKEYKHYTNKDFVRGCPEFFMFGSSQTIGLDRVHETCLEVMTPKTPSGEYRNVVVVGHDVAQDVDLILTVDLDVYDLPGLKEIVDNQRMQQHRKRFYNPKGLSSVLTDLEIQHSYLHNAGNDAVYTLQSMLAHSVRMRVNSLANLSKPSSPRKRPAFVEPGEDAGWSTNGEDTDGGEAPPPIDPLVMAKGKAPWLTNAPTE